MSETTHFVYVLRSLTRTDSYYDGHTTDVHRRISEHNAGKCNHAVKYRPWELSAFIAFPDSRRAIAFERYLKSGSGRASRLLSTLCLYKAGYDFKRLFTMSEYYDRDRPAFCKSIQGVRENRMDMTGWLYYFITGLMRGRILSEFAAKTLPRRSRSGINDL